VKKKRETGKKWEEGYELEREGGEKMGRRV
jgi:hypothetical protein